MIYEFFGLPGSGKTYCAKQFAQEKRMPLIEVGGRIEIYFWASVFACRHPRIFFFYLKKITEENGRDIFTALLLDRLFRHKIHNLYLRTIAKEGKTLFRKDAILDEGLSQILLYIFERTVEKKELIPFSSFFRNRTVSIVTASSPVRKKRMQSRGRTPRAFLGQAYKGKWLPIGYELSQDAYRQQRWFPTIEHNFISVSSWVKENFLFKEIHND